MSIASPPSGNRQHAMELIRLAGRRARLAQDAVRAEDQPPAPVVRGADADADAEPTATATDAAPPEADAVDVEMSIHLESVASMYAPVTDPDLPSPARTNTNLRHYLAAAMDTQPGFGAPPSGGPRWRSRLRRLAGGPPRQDDYNAAVLHVLHQLDHRTRMQEQRITALEARLAVAEGRRRGERS